MPPQDDDFKTPGFKCKFLSTTETHVMWTAAPYPLDPNNVKLPEIAIILEVLLVIGCQACDDLSIVIETPMGVSDELQ